MTIVQKLLIGLILSMLIGLGQQSYGQIDSRNQEKPAKQQATSPKKTKKVKKSKKDRKQAKGKKIYSNKKQLRNSKKSFKKGSDKGYKGDITGKKVKKPKTTPRKTYARPQPDPYAGRRIRTEKDRAAAPPKRVKTATKKGEVARTGDISGRKRIRQRSVSTNSKPVHRQPNTYRGVKRRTEKDRAYSNKKKIRNIRSVSKPSETPKRKPTTRIVTATAPYITKRKKNVYRNHTQRKGEQASTRDIAGKKLRTKNHKSPRPSGGGWSMANPKPRSDKTKSGERFKKNRFQAGGVRSVSRSSERSGGGQPIANQRNMKNFRSQKAKTVIRAKPVRSYGNRKKGNGEAAIFGAYRAKKIRSITKKSESKPGKRKPAPPSISSAGVFRNKNVHPYRGKDKRFSGENAFTKDIAGKTLRTKNFRSRSPNYGAFGTRNNRSISGSPSNKRYNNKAKSISGKSFNNNDSATTKRTIGVGVGVFAGKSKSQKRAQGGGSVSKRWNNNGNPLIRKGGGSISKRWNNNGNPLIKKGRGEGTAIATTYQGNIFPQGMNNPNIGNYQGDIKSKKGNNKRYPTQDFIGNVKVVSKKPPKAPGTEYGSAIKFAGIKFGVGAGKMEPRIKKHTKDINTLTVKVKAKDPKRSEGTMLGEKKTFTFITIGNPTKSGLVYQRKKLKVNKDLPGDLSRNQKMRTKAAPGTTRGTDWTLSFWTFGSPNHMGLKPQHVKAKGKMHPSTAHAYANKNSKDEKDKVVNVKLMWAKLFKKNAATPIPNKEYSHKLKYDKEERSIWETEEREDWYKN